jgi:hypothetical protein
VQSPYLVQTPVSPKKKKKKKVEQRLATEGFLEEEVGRGGLQEVEVKVYGLRMQGGWT